MRTPSALFLLFSMGAVACGGDDNAGNGAGSGAGGSAGAGAAASGGSAMDGGSGAGGSGGQGGTSDAGAADAEGTDDAAADGSYVDPCFGQMCGARCNSCPPSAPLCPGAIAFCNKAGQCVIGDSPNCDADAAETGGSDAADGDRPCGTLTCRADSEYCRIAATGTGGAPGYACPDRGGCDACDCLDGIPGCTCSPGADGFLTVSCSGM